MSTIFSYTDNGISSTDGITTDGTITLTLAEDTFMLAYSLDGGVTWNRGDGNSFILPIGTYDTRDILVLQMDAAHNTTLLSMNTEDGSLMVQLEGYDLNSASNYSPRIAAVGSSGEYVVTFGEGAVLGEFSFVQKFNANGTTEGSMVRQYSSTGGPVPVAQITAIGNDGEYAVTFSGLDYREDTGPEITIFVQKYNSDGTAIGSMVQLDGIGVINGSDSAPQITAVGNTGEYVVTFQGVDTGGDSSIFVQKFNADGTTAGSMVQLEAIGVSDGSDSAPQITAVGNTGEYVVTFQGVDTGGDSSIFVQKFNADGTTAGSMVQLEAIGVTNGSDSAPQITSVGSSGEYVVTFQGIDTGGDSSIFVQKFNSDGTTAGSMVQLEAYGVTNGDDFAPQITAVGDAGEYVVTFYGHGTTIGGEYAPPHEADAVTSVYVQKFNADGTIWSDNFNITVIPAENTAPTSADITVTTDEDTAIVLGLSDFAFNDINAGDTLVTVMITRLPTAGSLALDGVAVTLNKEILASDIASGKLIFTPAANANGTDYSSFEFNVSDGTDYSTSANTVTIDVTAVRDDLVLIGTNCSDIMYGDLIDIGSYDTLIGMGGNDYLNGGAGNDILDGGSGKDTLFGGSGADTFVFDTALSTKYNRDTITDFSASEDTIQLNTAIFTALTTVGTLDAANFVSNTTGTAEDTNDYILYNTTTGVLSYDADGSGSGAAIQIAIIGTTTHPTDLTYANFSVA